MCDAHACVSVRSGTPFDTLISAIARQASSTAGGMTVVLMEDAARQQQQQRLQRTIRN